MYYCSNIIFPDAPDSVSLSTIDFVVEDSPTDTQCTVSSIYPRSEETEFRVKVGSQYHTGGTESQSQDSNGVTYTVTYTQSLSFNRAQQGQEVQCEVIWGEGPIEVTKISNTKELDVYCKCVRLQHTNFNKAPSPYSRFCFENKCFKKISQGEKFIKIRMFYMHKERVFTIMLSDEQLVHIDQPIKY